jgi:hypothetical protein
MTKIPDPGRGLVRCFVRCLGLAAAAMLVLSVAPGQRAEALSLINPGAVPTAKYASGGLTTEVHGGHGSGGHGPHGSVGVKASGAVVHGGVFRSSSPVFRGAGIRTAHVFHGSGFHHRGFAFRHHHHRFHQHFYYAPSYYYYPHRYCRVIWTYYGPRRICHHRHWRHHYWRHHHHRHHRSTLMGETGNVG